MKDAIDTLMTNFGKFAQEHAGFRGWVDCGSRLGRIADASGGQVNVNDLKDMLASLPQFQTQREQFSLHLDMAQECMGLFEKKRLNLAAGVEQVSCRVKGMAPKLTAVLCDGIHTGRQNAQDDRGGDGAVAGRPDYDVSCRVNRGVCRR
jgi:hypothetical protein